MIDDAPDDLSSRASDATGLQQSNAPFSRVRRSLAHPLAQLIIAFLMLGLVQSFFVKLNAVPSASMEQTLLPGDRIVTDRTAYWFGAPQVGDVIVFNASEAWEEENPIVIDSPVEYGVRWAGELLGIGPGLSHTLVKRVVATAGQTIECCTSSGQLLVDGHAVNEPYIHNDLVFQAGETDCASTPRSMRCFLAYTVPEGRYVVLGDHRGNSSDSFSSCRGLIDGEASCVRTVREEDIVGRVFSVLFPNPRFLPDAEVVNETSGT